MDYGISKGSPVKPAADTKDKCEIFRFSKDKYTLKKKKITD